MSEIKPWSTTGALGEFALGLATALRRLGVDVRVVTPRYRGIGGLRYEADFGIQRNFARDLGLVKRGRVTPAGEAIDPGDATTAEGALTAYFVEHPGLFDRDGLYNEPGTDAAPRDFTDNALRFGTFARAALAMLPALEQGTGWIPDIIHANDWQSGLVPLFLRELSREDPTYRGIPCLFTVHDLRYQGIFESAVLGEVGLSWDYFRSDLIEFYGSINYTKAGIVFADAISTVSERYAEEIRTAAAGERLEGLLNARAAHLYGILGGLPEEEWNPATGKHLPAPYSASDPGGKHAAHERLCEQLGLRREPGPLIGVVAAYADARSDRLVQETLPGLLQSGFRAAVIAGSGQAGRDTPYASLAARFPGQLGLRTPYDEPTAHLLLAGADLLFLASRVEPTGSAPLAAFRFGTVPVVFPTGGLADTITQVTEDGLHGNGFVFSVYDRHEATASLRAAREMFETRPAAWASLQRRIMETDCSWDPPARKYLDLYERIGNAKPGFRYPGAGT